MNIKYSFSSCLPFFHTEHMEVSLLEKKVIQQLFHLTSDDVIIKALNINLLHKKLKE